MTLALVGALLAALSLSPIQSTPDLPAPPAAPDQPEAGPTNARVVEFSPDRAVRVQAAPGYQLMIELAPDEHVENVAVGDSGAWQVTANRRGDRLFLKPIRSEVRTNMIVVTDVRVYSFELEPLPGPQPDMAYAIRFRYPAPASATPADPEPVGKYKLGGDPALRPRGMHDDGVHTYIEWPPERALPAIYAIDGGKETLVNGMMRDGRVVIDSVQQRLVFRADGRRATALRVVGR